MSNSLIIAAYLYPFPETLKQMVRFGGGGPGSHLLKRSENCRSYTLDIQADIGPIVCKDRTVTHSLKQVSQDIIMICSNQPRSQSTINQSCRKSDHYVWLNSDPVTIGLKWLEFD